VREVIFSTAIMLVLLGSVAYAGDAEVKAAQTVIDSQLKAFQNDDSAAAYSFAAPSIRQIFPTVESFMEMVTNGYPPVHHPQSYAFGKVEETGATSIIQQVLIVGPDGKDYEAVYTLERQADGRYLITGVSLRASNTLST
jgi:hypothetical protein